MLQMLGIDHAFDRIPALLEFRDALGVDQEVHSAQVTGAFARKICPEVCTKGKLTACSNDHELHYKGKTERKERKREREREKKGRQMPLFPAFSARAIYLLSTCLLKRDRGAAKEGFVGRRKTTGKWNTLFGN
jgi:hypothetical protein